MFSLASLELCSFTFLIDYAAGLLEENYDLNLQITKKSRTS